MSRRSPRVALIALLAMAAVGAPGAAHAASPADASSIYPPSGSCTTSPATVEPGGGFAFQCAPATFSSAEQVTITVTGESGAGADIGMVRFAITTASGTTTSAGDGSIAPVRITLPQNASGTYNIAAVSSTSAGSTAAVTVTAPDGALPVSGMDSGSLIGLFVGGGALVLAGVALAVAALLRRGRARR
ncbi:cell wall protein [Microbacterium sp. ABRD28]|uniref:cell wall protein n=1 Tax=Microbacterium sp. ABRD28 TaxID=2268461 RepID=UPI000F559742|nr:cell wall protein [Microbacterium sp. ABRD28]AZC12448.1 cell wall protein [Microbacterium sp. ABRD28]